MEQDPCRWRGLPHGYVVCVGLAVRRRRLRNGNILTSTDPTGGANTWTRAAVYPPGCTLESTPCISEQLYAHDDQGTRVVDTAPPGQGNSIGNVAIASLVLSWTHDGASDNSSCAEHARRALAALSTTQPPGSRIVLQATTIRRPDCAWESAARAHKQPRRRGHR